MDTQAIVFVSSAQVFLSWPQIQARGYKTFMLNSTEHERISSDMADYFPKRDVRFILLK